MFYTSRGKVYELTTLDEFNDAVTGANGNIVAICYHNGCPQAEDAWNIMKPQYPNVHLYKVNTLNAEDIKSKYADGSTKPYFKFYKDGNLQDEVKYISSWSSHEQKVREFLAKHNGGTSMSYNMSTKVTELKNINELNGAFSCAAGKVVAVCFHNGCPTPEKAWDAMKPQYSNV